jgi:DNA-binding YbaB/EbfC family protein
MFGKIKDLHQLKKQADEMKKQLEDEIIEAENKGIKISMNGNQEVLSVAINPDLDKEDLEKYLKETFNDAVKKVQRVMAQKMMGSGNFGF